MFFLSSEIIFDNKVINQKKSYMYNIKLIQNKVTLCSRSKKELDEIDLEKELSPLDVNESYLIDNFKYFMYFEGFAMIFTFKAETLSGEIKDIYGIVFFSLTYPNRYDIKFFRLYTIHDVNVMHIILTKYLQNAEFEITVNWINMFLDKVDNLNEEKKFETFKMFIDLKNNFRFIDINNYDKLVYFVRNSIIKLKK